MSGAFIAVLMAFLVSVLGVYFWLNYGQDMGVSIAFCDSRLWTVRLAFLAYINQCKTRWSARVNIDSPNRLI